MLCTLISLSHLFQWLGLLSLLQRLPPPLFLHLEQVRVRSHQSPRSHLLVLPLGLLLVSGCPLKQPLGLTDFLVPLHLGLPERNVMNWRSIPVCPESHLRSDLVCMNLCCALSLSSGTHLVLK